MSLSEPFSNESQGPNIINNSNNTYSSFLFTNLALHYLSFDMSIFHSRSHLRLQFLVLYFLFFLFLCLAQISFHSFGNGCFGYIRLSLGIFFILSSTTASMRSYRVCSIFCSVVRSCYIYISVAVCHFVELSFLSDFQTQFLTPAIRSWFFTRISIPIFSPSIYEFLEFHYIVSNSRLTRSLAAFTSSHQSLPLRNARGLLFSDIDIFSIGTSSFFNVTSDSFVFLLPHICFFAFSFIFFFFFTFFNKVSGSHVSQLSSLVLHRRFSRISGNLKSNIHTWLYITILYRENENINTFLQ